MRTRGKASDKTKANNETKDRAKAKAEPKYEIRTGAAL
jgi:hypothetical protein